MRGLGTILCTLILAGALAGCGEDGDDDGGEPAAAETSFATQANALCVEGNRAVVEADLDIGYVTNEREEIERLERLLPVRRQLLSELEALEPPVESAEGFDAFLANRRRIVDATATLLDAYVGDMIARKTLIEAAGADLSRASTETGELATDIGLADCGGVLPADDAAAAEAALQALLDADPETACSTDGIVTDVYLEEDLGGVEECEKLQERYAEDPTRLPDAFEVSNPVGVDDTFATLEYELVGGEFDGVRADATLFYLDGGWKIFSITAVE